MIFQRFLRNFAQGLLVVVPAALTIWILWTVVTAADRVLPIESIFGRKLPGAGVVITLIVITFVGFIARSIGTRWVQRNVDRAFARLPLVRLLHGALRDLLEAFVGERKRFERPVLVNLDPTGSVAVIGFLTRKDLAGLGFADRVAVYIPQSYNFAGNLIIVPANQVQPLNLDTTSAMTFILSAGVTGEIPKGS